jgi:V/A-type H+-transporting ATPase subunit C
LKFTQRCTVIRVDIGYVNARIRGMKSRLFDHETLNKMILKPDIDSIISELEHTDYKEDIEKASVQSKGIHCIEDALRMNLSRTYRLILDMVWNENFEKYICIFANRWDIQNIKTVLRGTNIHISADEILESLAPSGVLDQVTLVELVKQPDVRAVVDLLATWELEYAIPLTQNFEKYHKKRDLAVLEYALDKFYFKRSLENLDEKNYNDLIVRDLITTEIDIINLKSVLRLIRDGINPEDGKYILIEGGKIFDDNALLELIRTGSIKDAIAKIENTRYSFLGEIPRQNASTEKISDFEKELDKFLIKKGIETSRGDPLSIAVVIGYLWAKNNEVTNIRIISRCKDAFVPEEELRKELLYV